jgi:hypothetical protein
MRWLIHARAKERDAHVINEQPRTTLLTAYDILCAAACSDTIVLTWYVCYKPRPQTTKCSSKSSYEPHTSFIAYDNKSRFYRTCIQCFLHACIVEHFREIAQNCTKMYHKCTDNKNLIAEKCPTVLSMYSPGNPLSLLSP